jgi:hypothetical protein
MQYRYGRPSVRPSQAIQRTTGRQTWFITRNVVPHICLSQQVFPQLRLLPLKIEGFGINFVAYRPIRIADN